MIEAGALALIMIATIAVLFFAVFVLWIIILAICLKSDLPVEEKLFWAIIILFLGIIGGILYLVLSRYMKRRITGKGKQRGKRLVRSRKNRFLAGVCGGLGDYLSIDPTIVRLLWIVLSIFFGLLTGIVAYIVAAVIMPEK